jgi:hypothetical protein
MRRLENIILFLFLFGLMIRAGFTQPLINEIVSSNITGIEDEYEVDKQNCPVPDCDWWYDRMGQSTHDGDYPDWIEIYNPASESIDLAGYGLSDDPSEPFKWVFPQVKLEAHEHLLVFASGKDRKEPGEVAQYMHTNFKIDRRGETISLTDNTGALCDSIDTGEIPIGFSLGRYPDGGAGWTIFSQPTPAESNITAPFPGFTDSIRPLHPAGFYAGNISLTLTATSSTAEIRYTLDGDDPLLRSRSYTGPIPIGQTTVVKARTFENGIVSSQIVTQTYFINEKFTMPVISLSTPPDNLWDDEFGIYVPGNNADEGNRVANYWQDWERPVHVEFYESDGTPGFSVDAGLQIFGWATRANALKSLAIMLRDRYGQEELNYPLFPDFPITTFKSFVLRAGASDWQGTYFRDPFASNLVKKKNLDMQAFRPAIVFINGEYWGIQNIREKLNEDYLTSHHGIDKDNVDIISRYWRRTYPVVIEGDDQAYLALEDYLAKHDINEPKHYEHIKSIMDVDNYLDYCVSQIYFANYDWPGNNIKCWRARTPNGKWRWLMYDLDYIFNSNGNNNYMHNTLEHATTASGNGWPNPPYTTFLLRKMLESEQFRIDFINRFADFMNSVFIADTILKKIDEMEALFEPEMPRHIQSWGRYGNTMRSMNDWEDNIDVLRVFAENRSRYVYQHIRDKFNLKGWDRLALDISQSGGGKIKINSMILNQYPWKGDYFLEVPIELSALPNSGFRFTGWSGLSAGDSLSNPVTIQLSGALSVTARFEKDNNALTTVVFNEINYNSSTTFDPEDWVELYNPYSNSIDISGWIFEDEGQLNAFVIPRRTVVPADGYFVLCRNAAAFHKLFTGVSNYAGDFNFGLDSHGDLIRLFNDQEQLIDSLSYRSTTPWPEGPNGSGPTLSLRSPLLDNSIPQNWGASIGYGTPGAVNDLTSNVHLRTISDSPSSFSLSQNYPNPFNPNTKISYSIPKPCLVRVAVYDILGKEIRILVNKYQEAGQYDVDFDAKGLSNGVYFYKLQAGDRYVGSKKMLLLK